MIKISNRLIRFRHLSLELAGVVEMSAINGMCNV